MNAKEILSDYVSRLEKIIIELNYNEENAVKLLDELKKKLSAKHSVDDAQKEVFGACVYNVLATINSVPNQSKKSAQLLSALTEAKEEISVISEIM